MGRFKLSSIIRLIGVGIGMKVIYYSLLLQWINITVLNHGFRTTLAELIVGSGTIMFSLILFLVGIIIIIISAVWRR